MSRVTRKQVMATLEADERASARCRAVVGTVAANVESGREHLTQSEIGLVHMRSASWAYYGLKEAEALGYLERFREPGANPARHVLCIPSAEQRAKDLAGITRKTVRIRRRANDEDLIARVGALTDRIHVLELAIESLIGVIAARLPRGEP